MLFPNALSNRFSYDFPVVQRQELRIAAREGSHRKGHLEMHHVSSTDEPTRYARAAEANLDTPYFNAAGSSSLPSSTRRRPDRSCGRPARGETFV